MRKQINYKEINDLEYHKNITKNYVLNSIRFTERERKFLNYWLQNIKKDDNDVYCKLVDFILSDLYSFNKADRNPNKAKKELFRLQYIIEYRIKKFFIKLGIKEEDLKNFHLMQLDAMIFHINYTLRKINSEHNCLGEIDIEIYPIALRN